MKRIFIIFLISILTCNLFAQIRTSIDSTQIIYAQSLHDKGYQELSIGNYKTAIKYIKEAVYLRKQIFGDNNIEHIKSLHNLSLCYAGLDDFNKAVDIAQEILLKTKGRSELIKMNAIATRTLGSYYMPLGNYKEAME